MKLTKRTDIDPTEGPLLSAMITYSIPIILANIFATLYQSADMMVLSWFSVGNEVASVGASSTIVSLLLSIAIGLGSGGTVILSHLFGSKQRERVQNALSTMVLFSLAVGVLLALIGAFIMRPFLLWTNCPAECLSDAMLYAVVYTLGMPFHLLYNYVAGAIRVSGDSRHPLYYMLIGGGLNVVLNVLFCLIFERAVLAVALSTLIANALAAYLCVRLMVKTEGVCRWDYKKICIDFSVVRQILRYGVPSAVAASLYPIANLQMQSAINSFGPSAIAGNTACIQYEGIISNIGNGMNASATTFIGQNMGAKKKDRVLRSFFCVALAEFVTMLVLSALALSVGERLISVFAGNDAEALRIGVLRKWNTIALYIVAINPLAVTIVALGYPTLQTVISLVGICGFRTFWMQFVYGTALFPSTIENVYLGFPISIVLTHFTYAAVVAVLLIRYKKGRLTDKI